MFSRKRRHAIILIYIRNENNTIKIKMKVRMEIWMFQFGKQICHAQHPLLLAIERTYVITDGLFT